MSFAFATDPSLKIDLYLRRGSLITATQLIDFAELKGWVGASLVTAMDGRAQDLVELRFLTSRAVSEPLVVSYDHVSGLRGTQTIDSVLQELADLVGAEVYGNVEDFGYFAEPQSAVADDDVTGDTSSSDADSAAGIEATQAAPKSAFIGYGPALGSSIATPETVSFANEVSRDIKTPIVVAPYNDIMVAFPLENFSDYPTWVDRFPVVEVVHNEGLEVRWHSKNRPDGKGSKIFGGLAPRYQWHVDQQVPEVPRPLILETPEAVNSAGHQETITAITNLIEAWTTELAPSTEDIEEARALAAELGLDQEHADALVSILTDTSTTYQVDRILEHLGLPEQFSSAFNGSLDPADLDRSVTVEKGSFAGEINLRGLLERPEGNKITDRMRRMDFDQPVLALLLELIMVAAGFALIWAGITNWGIFATGWVSWVGYVLGAWWLIDGLASIWAWVMIRRQNRVGNQETPKS